MNIKLKRICTAAFCAALLLVCAPRACLAKTTLLDWARVVQTADGSDRVLLGFSGPPPAIRVLQSSPTEYRAILAGLTTDHNEPIEIAGYTTVKDVVITPSYPSAELRIDLRNATVVRTYETQNQIRVDTIPMSRQVPRAAPAPASNSPVVQIRRVKLKYADVSEVVGILVPDAQVQRNDLFHPQSTLQDASVMTSSYGAGGNFTPPSQLSDVPDPTESSVTSLGQRVNAHIAVDRRLNAIFLIGTESEIDHLEILISQIDVPSPAVMLETEIVELTQSAARDLGLDLNAQGLVATATSELRSQAEAAHDVLFEAHLFAEISHGNGRIIATPRVLALDGKAASILTGDAIPIITSITTPGSNVISQQVEYVNVGVNLQIRPRVTDDGIVMADVLSEVSSASNYNGTNIPQISQRRARTSLLVRDGNSFVIGGLLQESDISNFSKVPILGDIPILKSLFRVEHTSKQITNLYIIVKPHIIKTI